MSETSPPTRRVSGLARPDTLAVLALILLWLLYFWRIFTPSAGDALSLREGDFSGQFVAFFGYQVERLAEGEVPLWNPYNNAGHPFLADTQSAVFYPPRLLTVAAVTIVDQTAPGELYAALQNEMALHVLLGTLLMYAFVRRITAPDDGRATRASVIGGLVAALTVGYSGYLSGYPQLQLAVLEAGIWLPLVLLGIFQATRRAQPGWTCMVLAGVALGLSLLAGHPQTSLFTIYLALAFLAYRLAAHHTRAGWRTFARRVVLAAAVMALVAGGLAAVQLLPGLEYTRLTTRQDMTFDAKGNGLLFRDIIQVLFPAVLTEWSPLYVGIAGLILAVIALWRRVPFSAFFGIAALVGLGLSFGAGTILYDAAYLLLPGCSWFRGQERAAFIIAHSVSILAGLGTAHVLAWDVTAERARRVIRVALVGLLAACVFIAGVLLVQWRGPDGDTYAGDLRAVTFAALLAGLAAGVIPWLLRAPADSRRVLALVALVVFDLFSITQGTPNYAPVPAEERLPEPAIVDWLQAELPPGARVDGQRGLDDNYGTLYDVPDINGISPLRLASVDHLLTLPDDRSWDLLAVRYVLRNWEELMARSTIVDQAEDPFGPYNVHLLDDPRPFAHLTYRARTVRSDGEAYAILADPTYDIRLLQQIALLADDPGVTLPADPPDNPGTATVTHFAPEEITIQTDTPAPAILTIALPDYPGWQATVNGSAADPIRAYGGLIALPLPEAGTHTVELAYRPWTFTAGAITSVVTLLAVLGITLASTIIARRKRVTRRLV
jgi:hypothetical protein